MNPSYPLLQHHYSSSSNPASLSHSHAQALSAASNANANSKRYSTGNEGIGSYSLFGAGYGGSNGYMDQVQGQRNGEGR
jgi:hypothetical protein